MSYIYVIQLRISVVDVRSSCVQFFGNPDALECSVEGYLLLLYRPPILNDEKAKRHYLKINENSAPNCYIPPHPGPYPDTRVTPSQRVRPSGCPFHRCLLNSLCFTRSSATMSPRTPVKGKNTDMSWFVYLSVHPWHQRSSGPTPCKVQLLETLLDDTVTSLALHLVRMSRSPEASQSSVA